MNCHLVIWSFPAEKLPEINVTGAPGIRRWIEDCRVKCVSSLHSPGRLSVALLFILKR